MAQDTITPQEGFLQTLKAEQARPGVIRSKEDIQALAIRYGVEVPDWFVDAALQQSEATLPQKVQRTAEQIPVTAMRVTEDGLRAAGGIAEDALQKMAEYKLLDPNQENSDIGEALLRRAAGQLGAAMVLSRKGADLLGEGAEAVETEELVGRGGYVGEQIAPVVTQGLMSVAAGIAAGPGAAMAVGALQNAAPAYLDADAAGASIEKKWALTVANGIGGGLLEYAGLRGPIRALSKAKAMPAPARRLATVLAKVDKASDGALGEGLVGSTIYSGVRTAVSEATTESAQTVLQNILHDKLTPEDREWLEGVFEKGGAAELGAWAGLLFGVVAGPSLRRQRIRERRQRGEPDLVTPKRDPEALKREIAEGPVGEYLGRVAEMAGMEGELDQAFQHIAEAEDPEAAIDEVVEEWTPSPEEREYRKETEREKEAKSPEAIAERVRQEKRKAYEEGILSERRKTKQEFEGQERRKGEREKLEDRQIELGKEIDVQEEKVGELRKARDRGEVTEDEYTLEASKLQEMEAEADELSERLTGISPSVEDLGGPTEQAAEGEPAPETEPPPLSPTEEPSAAPPLSAEAARRAAEGKPETPARKKAGEADRIIRESTGTLPGEMLNEEQVRRAAEELYKRGYGGKAIRNRIKKKANLMPARERNKLRDRLRALKEDLWVHQSGRMPQGLYKHWKQELEKKIRDTKRLLADSISENAIIEGEQKAMEEQGLRRQVEAQAQEEAEPAKTVEEAARGIKPVRTEGSWPIKREVQRAKIRQRMGVGVGETLTPEQITRSAQIAQQEGMSKEDWEAAISDDLVDLKKKATRQERELLDLGGTVQAQELELDAVRENIKTQSKELKKEQDKPVAARDMRAIWDLEEEIRANKAKEKLHESAIEDARRKAKGIKYTRPQAGRTQQIWDMAERLQFGKDEAQARQRVREATDTSPFDKITPDKYAQAIRALREAKEAGADIPKAKAREIFDRMTDGDSAFDEMSHQSDLELERGAQRGYDETFDEAEMAAGSVGELQARRQSYREMIQRAQRRLEKTVTPEQFDRMWGPEKQPEEPQKPKEKTQQELLDENLREFQRRTEEAQLERAAGNDEAADALESEAEDYADSYNTLISQGVAAGAAQEKADLDRRHEIRRKSGLQPGDPATRQIITRTAVVARQMGLTKEQWQKAMGPDLAGVDREMSQELWDKYQDLKDTHKDALADFDPMSMDEAEAKRERARIDALGEQRREAKREFYRFISQEKMGDVYGKGFKLELDKIWNASGDIANFAGGVDGIVEMHAGGIGPKAYESLKADAEAAKRWMASKLEEAGFSRQDDGHLAEGFQRTMYQRIFDRLNPLKKLQVKAHALGADSAYDVYLDESLRRGRTADRLRRADVNHFKPIVRKLRKLKMSMEDADLWALARHAPERNKALVERQQEFKELNKGLAQAIADGDLDAENEIRNVLNLVFGNPDVPTKLWDLEKNPPSGISNSKAKKIVSEMEAKYGAQALADLGRDFDRMNNERLRVLQESGLISQELHDHLRKIYPKYAPMRTMMAHEMGRTGLGGEPLKKAKGRKSVADSPFAFAMSQLQEAIIRAEKNRVLQGLQAQIDANPDAWNGFARVFTPEQLRKLRVLRPEERSFKVWIDGKAHLIRFEPEFENVAMALNQMNSADLNRFSRISGVYSRFLAQMSTRLNPAFFGPNFMRDLVAGYVHSLEHGTKFANKVGKDAIPAARALLQYEFKGVTSDWLPWIERYEKSGARITFLDLKNPEQFVRQLQREVAAPDRRGLGAVTVEGVGRLFEGVSDSFENAVRLSFFKHAVTELGMTDAQAALAAKDLTTNFERRGDFGNLLNAWFMFSNAGLQGIDRVRRAMKHPQVRKAVAISFAAQIGWGFLGRALMGKDRDGEDLWDKIPAWEKHTQLIIPIGWLTGEPMDRINIPLPRVYSFLNAVAQDVPSVMSGDLKPGKGMGRLWEAGLQEFVPFDMSQGTVEAFGIGLPLPTLGQLPVQLLSNRDWKGAPIRPQDWGGLKPRSHQAWADINPIALKVAHGLNWLTGGSAYKPGLVDVSPENIEHVFETAVGGLGATLTRTLGSWAYVWEGEVPPAYEIPISRRFWKRRSPFRTSEQFKDASVELEREHLQRRAEDEEASPTPMLSAARKAKRKAAELRKKADESSNRRERDRLLEEADRVQQDFMRNYRSGTVPQRGTGFSRGRRGGRRGFRRTSRSSGGFR